MFGEVFGELAHVKNEGDPKTRAQIEAGEFELTQYSPRRDSAISDGKTQLGSSSPTRHTGWGC